MALIESNRTPSARELRWFGLIVLATLVLIGGMVRWQTASQRVPEVLWGAGIALALLYYLVPALRRSIYAVWMGLVFPIGWLVSHSMLAIVYFVVITPTAVLMRAFGRDRMARGFDRNLPSYWVEEDPGRDAADYFRQS
jgi:hypothetical protein